MRFTPASRIGEKEARPVRWFQEVGSNFGTLGRDIRDTYLTGPYKKNDNLQKLTGPVVGFVSGAAEAIDYGLAGALDEKLEAPTGIFGRTRRDLGGVLKNAVQLRPLRFGASVLRAISINPLLDTGDVLLGFKHGAATRARVAQALADDTAPEYRLAA